MSEIIFGNTTDFGIRYVPGWNLEENRLPVGNLHLILGGQLIGDKDELCLIGTWVFRMEHILSVLENDVDKLFYPEFENRSDEEIFELIFKSNQLPEEFHPDFLNLPTLPPKVWQYCYVGLDETTDAYLIGMICKGDELKFMWQGLSAPCLPEHLKKCYSVSLQKNGFVETVKACLNYVKKDIESYKLK